MDRLEFRTISTLLLSCWFLQASGHWVHDDIEIIILCNNEVANHEMCVDPHTVISITEIQLLKTRSAYWVTSCNGWHVCSASLRSVDQDYYNGILAGCNRRRGCSDVIAKSRRICGNKWSDTMVIKYKCVNDHTLKEKHKCNGEKFNGRFCNSGLKIEIVNAFHGLMSPSRRSGRPGRPGRPWRPRRNPTCPADMKPRSDCWVHVNTTYLNRIKQKCSGSFCRDLLADSTRGPVSICPGNIVDYVTIVYRCLLDTGQTSVWPSSNPTPATIQPKTTIQKRTQKTEPYTTNPQSYSTRTSRKTTTAFSTTSTTTRTISSTTPFTTATITITSTTSSTTATSTPSTKSTTATTTITSTTPTSTPLTKSTTTTIPTTTSPASTPNLRTEVALETTGKTKSVASSTEQIGIQLVNNDNHRQLKEENQALRLGLKIGGPVAFCVVLTAVIVIIVCVRRKKHAPRDAPTAAYDNNVYEEVRFAHTGQPSGAVLATSLPTGQGDVTSGPTGTMGEDFCKKLPEYSHVTAMDEDVDLKEVELHENNNYIPDK